VIDDFWLQSYELADIIQRDFVIFFSILENFLHFSSPKVFRFGKLFVPLQHEKSDDSANYSPI